MGEWVQIIHPETGGTGEVHRDSLTQHYASGWRLLAPDELPQPEPPQEPPPLTKAEAGAKKKAATAENEEN